MLEATTTANIPQSVGPIMIELEGKKVLLNQLAPQALSGLVDYIFKNKKPQSTLETVYEQTARLKMPETLAGVIITKAMELDHEERMRERFSEPKLPTSAFFDADVCAMMLSLAASANQPDMTPEVCKGIVDRMGPIAVIATISRALPENTAKKDTGSSDS
jgi:hypothetical protein